MSAYCYPFIFQEVIIDGPGEYLTRGGERVTIDQASSSLSFDCAGRYADCGTQDRWSKSGRLFAGTLSQNDIVARS